MVPSLLVLCHLLVAAAFAVIRGIFSNALPSTRGFLICSSAREVGCLYVKVIFFIVSNAFEVSLLLKCDVNLIAANSSHMIQSCSAEFLISPENSFRSSSVFHSFDV